MAQPSAPHRSPAAPLATPVLRAVAAAFRLVPQFRGKYHLARAAQRFLLHLGAEPLVTGPMRDGYRLRLDLRSGTEFYAYYSGAYERGSVRLLGDLLRPGTAALDVGANIGFYTVPLARRARSVGAVVRAYEPVPANFTRLLENLALNGLTDAAQCFPFGLSDRAGVAPITLREDFLAGAGTGNAALAAGAPPDRFHVIPVELRPIDAVSEDLGPLVSVIKLDVEGHEDLVLRGGRRLLERDRPVVLMEIAKSYYRRRGLALDACFDAALPAGYRRLRPLDRDGRRWAPFASYDECFSRSNIFAYPEERAGEVEGRLRVVS